MTLKEAIQIPCGLRYMVDALDIQSGVAKRHLLETSMVTSHIEDLYQETKEWIAVLEKPNHRLSVQNLQFRLRGLKDLTTTLTHLQQGHTLDDIELYELKHLSILTKEVNTLLQTMGIRDLVTDLKDVLRLLDPDCQSIDTFYVYDTYSSKLSELRKRLTARPDDEQVFCAIQDEEQSIREELTQQLHPFFEKTRQALHRMIDIDIHLSIALQVTEWGLCLPEVGEKETRIQEMWNPEVAYYLANRQLSYQRNSITFGRQPILITGSNMGGKTVVLKNVALCQLLMQFGMGIPARQATIMPEEQLFCSMADGQNIADGLSSFASEMRQIDTIIQAARESKNLLALIDEPARTTNPQEGTALVDALIDVLKPLGISLLIVTHYTTHPHGCQCLRVQGMTNGKMDYTLVPTEEGDVPHEAINIAEQLHVDKEWLQLAKQRLKPNKEEGQTRNKVKQGIRSNKE